MSGHLGSALLVPEINTLIYEVPAGKIATANIRVSNQNSTPVMAWVGIGFGAAPEPKNWITPGMTVEANDFREDTGIMLSAGQKIWVRVNKANVSVNAFGPED